jgi:YD repeat-containing protein
MYIFFCIFVKMFIMGYLKFTLTLLFELIKTNIAKTIFVIVAIVSFNYAETFPPSTNQYHVVAETKVENTYIYVCESISDNKIKYENVWQEGKPLDVKNGVIYMTGYNGANIFFWVLFSISVLIVTICTFINDDDAGWEFSDCWEDAFCTLIYCEEENGEFYYFALGRLISKTNRQVSRSYKITNELHIDGFRDLYRCPKYQTKTQRRETLLNKIGIN